MSKVNVYLVRVYAAGKTVGSKAGWRETLVSSLRAAISLTYGLACDWEVISVTGQFIGNAAYLNPSDKAFARKWSHNVRAFRQSLKPTFIELAYIAMFSPMAAG